MVTPKGRHTNQSYAALKARESRMQLYEHFVGVTWLFCEIDLFALVSDSLDYYIRKAFLESDYMILVPDVFNTTNAEDVRYVPIARYIRLGHFASAAHRNAAANLLSNAESALADAVELNISTTREDLRTYNTSSLKDNRIFGTHVFSSLLKNYLYGPLDMSQFPSSLPIVKSESFDFSNMRALRYIAIRALVLKDLEERMANDMLQGDSKVIHEIAFKLIKKLFSEKVPFSFKVVCGTLFAQVIRSGETEEDITHDHIFVLKKGEGLQLQVSAE